mmetsp:Transcript_5265/g.15464  ORF Transcript_5265/g.15464 Transcript_5265/m.15464 type:complete len:222 (-) Transcript_5265:97-762(-)
MRVCRWALRPLCTSSCLSTSASRRSEPSSRTSPIRYGLFSVSRATSSSLGRSPKTALVASPPLAGPSTDSVFRAPQVQGNLRCQHQLSGPKPETSAIWSWTNFQECSEPMCRTCHLSSPRASRLEVKSNTSPGWISAPPESPRNRRPIRAACLSVQPYPTRLVKASGLNSPGPWSPPHRAAKPSRVTSTHHLCMPPSWYLGEENHGRQNTQLLLPTPRTPQ